MLRVAEDIHPLTDFKRETPKFARHLKKTRRPLVLTVNGKAEFVVLDAAAYQEMLDRMETVEAVREGLQQAERGEGRPAKEVFAEMRRKYGLHRKNHASRTN
jgi:PHD/YefM family antitoxin component YafN of YafNO toxin-antitoxin module